MNGNEIDRYLGKLAQVYAALGGSPLTIDICGGAALALLCLVDRTTKDIDLINPPKWPAKFSEAVEMIADEYGLPMDWINSGPRELAEMGLPDGFADRATIRVYGNCMTARIASRLDQIYFKTYASVDRGGYHVDDLLQLNPTTDELVGAGRWCMTHDVSDVFKQQLRSMFEQLGFGDAARSI